MSAFNKKTTENLSLVWIELAIMLATSVCTAFFFLALHKTDVAAWIFLAVLAAAGVGACVFFCVKAHKEYVSANANEKPKCTLAFSIVFTAVAGLGFAVSFIITLISFLI